MKYIGIDEAGRGTLFGSVFAGAVIWDDKIDSSSFTDSKKMSKKNRAIARQYIEDNAIAFGVGFATNKEVDYINIRRATFMAMHRAIDDLFDKNPSLLEEDIELRIDGNCFEKYKRYHHNTFVKGDLLYKEISAASVLAKQHHDDDIVNCVNADRELEKYGLLGHMGYATKVHIEAIRQYGPSSFHRMTFKPIKRF